MKKFISFLLAASVAAAISVPAFAASDIAVKVNGRTVTFREDTKPVVLNDRTYVPVRRVLNYMGATVNWNEEKRTVTVDSPDNITRIVLTIDNKDIEVYTFVSIIAAEKSVITSDVAPIIINDRTMLPIRVIAEALGATVTYDESGIAEIVTKTAKAQAAKEFNADPEAEDFNIAEVVSQNLPKLSIDCDNKDIKKGDTVSVKVKLADIEKFNKDAKISGLAVTLYYDNEQFEYDGFNPVPKDTAIAASADNPVFYENASKSIFIVLPQNSYLPDEDGSIAELNFVALENGGGEFALSDGISEIGYDNELILTVGDEVTDLFKYNDLYIDTTPILVK